MAELLSLTGASKVLFTVCVKSVNTIQRPNEKKVNVDLFLKKVIQKSVRLIWSAEK